MLTSNGAPLKCSFIEGDWHVLAAFWHPVAFKDEVRDRPVRVTLLDVDLVLWRTKSGVHAAADYCPHRGTRMSIGYVRENSIVCKYHGLHFNDKGRCTAIPSAKEGAKIPRSLCLATYPVKERYGVLWVCLKGEALTDIPEWTEIEDPKLQRIKMDTVWNVAAGRHTENFLDTAHFSTAHLGTFGWAERPDVEDYDVTEEDFRLSYSVNAPQQNGSLFLEDRAYSAVPSDYAVTFPFSTKLVLHFPRGDEIIFDMVCPISADKSRIFMIKTRDHDHEHYVDEWAPFQIAVNEQDREIVEAQIPHSLPVDLQEEFHIASDKISVAFRKKWAELGMTGTFL